MTMKFLILAAGWLILLQTISCTQGGQDAKKSDSTGKQTASAQGAQQYYCPMHPQVKSDKPSICPICQMDLVLPGHEDEMGMETGESDSTISIRFDERRQAFANVMVAPVRQETISRTIRALGALAIAEPNRFVIAARFSGRIERLFVRQTGDYIRAGQPLFEVYSPDLIQAQNDFLLALKSAAQSVLSGQNAPHGSLSNESVRQFVQKARERLQLLGLTKEQIARLEQTQEPQTRVVIHSPYTGTVMQKSITEGAYMSEGTQLYSLVELSTVWNLAEVYEADARYLQPGSRVEFTTSAYPGERFYGILRTIAPVVSAESRTIQVRLEVSNSAMRLRPGMYTEALLPQRSESSLVVPDDAVVVTGKQSLVWVQDPTEPARFEARVVKTGIRSNGKTQILSGLIEGEQIAVSGGFLLDSERQLRGLPVQHNHSH